MDLKHDKPTILLMGLRRSGKSSICRVVFGDMQPLDTLYIESTSKATTFNFTAFIDFTVYELPGQLDYFEPTIETERLFQNHVDALIYIIDSQDEYLHALTNLHAIIEFISQVNPNIRIEVFIHKVDGLSEDFRIDTQRDITQRVNDDLMDAGLDDKLSISFHLTSIFDHSIYEALSRVVQKMLPQLPTFENLLNLFCQHSNVDKAFLFDINSKIYVATDASPVDVQTYELCSDFIDVAVDLDNLYHANSLDFTDNTSTHTNKTTDKTASKTTNTVSCTSRLNSGLTLYLQHMVRGLALVYLMRRESASKAALVDCNVEQLSRALGRVWLLASEASK